MRHTPKTRGFTIIETMVAIGIFSVVMTVAMGALLTVTSANKKAQKIRAAMDNLNFAMEVMAREIRLGSAYHCDATGIPVGPSPVAPSALDCPSTPADSFVFMDATGNNVVAYALEPAGCVPAAPAGVKSICKKDTLSDVYERLTSPEITIDQLSFYVTGAQTVNDHNQPQVHITISGSAIVDKNATTKFSLQTTLTQRQIDANN